MKKLSLLLATVLILLTFDVSAVVRSDGRSGGQYEAYFAMGCFWCAEAAFRDKDGNLLTGITDLKVGYAGGTKPNPTYESHEGYREAVKVSYNPKLMPYDKLISIFWHNIDPFDAEGQFCDKGPSYTAAIYVKNAGQREIALKTKEEMEARFKQTIHVAILPYLSFYDAEANHQNYKSEHPFKYKYYRWQCKRDQRLETVWGKGKD